MSPRQFHFDAATYLDAVRAEVPAYDDLQQVIADTANERPYRSVLDLGTGTGETIRRIAERDGTVRIVAIDESAAILELARVRVPGAEYRVARLQDDLPDGEFDLVVSALAVHHLTPGEKVDLFARVAARLSTGGRFVMGDVVVPPDPADAVTPLDPPYDRPSTLEDQTRWLAAAGLRTRVVWQDRDLAVLVASR